MKYFQAASVTPTTALAGDSVEIRVRLETGPDFSFHNSRIIFDLPASLGTSRPTRHHQEQSGFVEILCSDPHVEYSTRVWDMETEEFAGSGGRESHLGMAQRIVVVDFNRPATAAAGTDTPASAGAVLEFVWGYLCDGFSVGTKVTTLVPHRDFCQIIHARYFVDGSQGLPDYGRSFAGYRRPEPDIEIPLSIRIIPRDLEKIRVIRRPSGMTLLPLDRFGNVAEIDAASTVIKEEYPFNRNQRGAFELPDPHAMVTSTGLPLRDSPAMDDVWNGYNIYFGDLHTHTSLSIDCIEREKQSMDPELSVGYGRNAAALDFMAVTDHHQPGGDGRHTLGESGWDVVTKAVEKANEPGRFIGISGYEYRCRRGDTVVLFGEPVDYSRLNDPGAGTIENLWALYSGLDYITIPHFHNPGSLDPGQWRYPDRQIEPVLEVFSCHGSYERERVVERGRANIKKNRPDRNAEYFLKNGYRYGFICNSDGHKGNPGSNGLTAVFVRELTLEGIFEALRSRRVYGTTNARIRLVFTIDDELMGSELEAAASHTLRISVAGDGPLKVVDLFKNGAIWKRYSATEIEFSTQLQIDAEPGDTWYVRVTQADNHIAYASPIWLS